MEIIEANITHANIIGIIHSMAWRQAYKDIFPEEYLKQESVEKRKQEFVNGQEKNVY